nr:hypothetical protein [uncultured Acetatifactor sp.]
MSKLLNLKADGTFNVSVEEHLFDNVRKAHTWYTSKFTSFPALVLLALIDIIGFKQIIDLTVVESNANRFAITASLAIAFDLASLYLGYALCLKCYHLGRLIHNWALAFSLTACGLGIIANAVFRILTMNVAYVDSKTGEETGLAITIFMCVSPIITSLVSITIGCLTLNPLHFELLQRSKKIAKLQLRKSQVMACLEEFKDEKTLEDSLAKEETACYENVQKEIYALRTALKTFTVIQTSSIYTTKKK